jgi:hypothetical protein
MEYLLVGDQMLWFGTLLPSSLINPNQLWAYGLPFNDNPFDTHCSKSPSTPMTSFPLTSDYKRSTTSKMADASHVTNCASEKGKKQVGHFM